MGQELNPLKCVLVRMQCNECAEELDAELEEAQAAMFPSVTFMDDANEGDSPGAHLIRQYVEYA